MHNEHEYTKLYGDIVALYLFYWPLHQQLPEDIQRTTGERVLSEITDCLHALVKANAMDSRCDKERHLARSHLAEVAVSIDIIKALLTLCQQLKWITQGTLAVLTAHTSQITRNINSWSLRLAVGSSNEEPGGQPD